MIPSNINVLGVKFKVKILSTKKMDEIHGQNVYGNFNCNNRMITIRRQNNNEEELATFLHELSHAIMWVSGVSQAMTNEMSEVVAQTFSYAFIEYLKSTVVMS